MKFLPLLFVFIFSALAAENIKHSFIVVDNKQKKVIKVDQVDSTKNWSTSFDQKPRALQMLKGSLLVGLEDGYAELNPLNGKISKRVNGYKNIQSAYRFPDGRTLLGQDGDDIKFHILDKENKLIKTVSCSGKYLRLTDVSVDEKLLFTSGEPWVGVCMNLDGKILWTVPLPDKGYRLMPLPNGNLLTSTGESAKVCEINAGGNIVKTYGGEDIHPKAQLQWFSGYQKLGENVIAANWLGHDRRGQGPHLVEFNSKNQIIWSWTDHKTAIQVTNFIILK